MNRLIFVCIGLAFLVGCGPKIEPLPEAVTVSGKLTSAGAPVGDVVLTLQPVELGHPVPMQVGADGSYSGKIVPGKYVYFVSAKEANPNAIDKVDAKYREADMSRTVTVAAGQASVDIALD